MIKLNLVDVEFENQIKKGTLAYFATDGDEKLGFCEFEIGTPIGKIYQISCDDVPLIDGLLRQTLFYMAQKMCLIAELDDALSKKLSDLYMIKSGQKEINIAEFFDKPCCSK